MSWENKKNVLRIFNTFKRLKDKIYPQDIDPLKEIDNFINQKSKQNTKDNLIYAKILAIYLKQNIYYYKDIRTAIKSVRNELKMPLEKHIEVLSIELNNNELFKTVENLGCNLNKTNLDKSFLSDPIKRKEFESKLLNSWTYDNVEKSFYNTANDLLKDVNNYT